MNEEMGLNEGWFINPWLFDEFIKNEGKISKE